MTIKVEKKVPIPPKNKYPFKNMKTGDSFWVESASERNSAWSVAKYLGLIVTTKREGDGFRVWLTGKRIKRVDDD